MVLRESYMSKSAIIALSLIAIVLASFAYQSERAVPQTNKNDELTVDEKESIAQSSAEVNQPISNLNSSLKTNNAEILSEKPSEALTAHLVSKSAIKAKIQNHPSDHQGEYNQARPHGYENHNVHSQQRLPIPPGEPKKALTSQQPLN